MSSIFDLLNEQRFPYLEGFLTSQTGKSQFKPIISLALQAPIKLAIIISTRKAINALSFFSGLDHGEGLSQNSTTVSKLKLAIMTMKSFKSFRVMVEDG